MDFFVLFVFNDAIAQLVYLNFKIFLNTQILLLLLYFNPVFQI